MALVYAAETAGGKKLSQDFSSRYYNPAEKVLWPLALRASGGHDGGGRPRLHCSERSSTSLAPELQIVDGIVLKNPSPAAENLEANR
mmetsp:Transcript_16242/g.61885  ORF Transcript_16242/g.61885 Transcript_16242/m.61885 type:complete len:87 (-) Transcript_16242:858-1118(-)